MHPIYIQHQGKHNLNQKISVKIDAYFLKDIAEPLLVLK